MIETPAPIQVCCDDLQFDPHNPRTITAEEIEALKASIEQSGVIESLVVQRESDDGTPLVLIGGHQRVRAIRELCAERDEDPPEHLWAIVLDVDDFKAKQINLALNKIGGDFDAFKLSEVMSEIGPLMTVEEALATGFLTTEIDDLIAVGGVPCVGDGGGSSDEPSDASPKLGDLEYRVIVLCTSESHQREVLVMLEQKGLECRALIS